MRCPNCGPLDYNEALVAADTEWVFCGLCGEELPHDDLEDEEAQP